MKKTFKMLSLMMVMILGIAMAACSDDDKDEYVPEADLPQVAQTFLSTYYPQVAVTYVNRETDDGYVQYEVTLVTRDKVTFDVDGIWVDVDAPDGKSIPDGIADPSIVSYVASNYSGAGINEISRIAEGFDVELTNGVELLFDADGQFIRIDY